MILKDKFKLFRKGKFLIALAITAAITVPVTVFAATSDTTAAKSIRGFFGIDASKLTDKQKETVKNYSQKFADLQKQFIDDMISNGAMTKEQGDEAKKKIDEDQKNSDANGSIPGFFGEGRKGFGMIEKQRGPGIFGVDPSKLTDTQKKDLADSYKNIAGIQKDYIGKMVNAGLISKENGNVMTRKIDEMIADLDKNGAAEKSGGLMNGFGGFSGFRFFGAGGANASKLTDEQKNIMTDYSKKLAEAQKQLIGKMVSDGAITKEQGDALTKKIDAMSSFNPENTIPMNGMMKKGHMEMRGKGSFRKGGSVTQAPANPL